jgi:hypothetical protein
VCLFVFFLCTRRMVTLIGLKLCVCVLVCVCPFARGTCSRGLLRGCMRLWACLCVLVHQAHGHCGCCEAIHPDACCFCVFLFTRRMVTVIAARRCILMLVLFVLVHNAHAHCDCSEVKHACVRVCVVVLKTHGHCDCCEAMDACACLCYLVHNVHAH